MLQPEEMTNTVFVEKLSTILDSRLSSQANRNKEYKQLQNWLNIIDLDT